MKLPFLYRRPLSLAQREELDFYIFAAPWILGLLFLFGGPVLASLSLSFTSWTGVSLASLQFIGLENYQAMFSDKLFWISLYVTAYYALGSVFLGVILSLFIAVLLNQRVPGTSLFRTIFYLPSITSGVAIAVMWIWIFNPRVGLLNYALSWLGLNDYRPRPVGFTTESRLAAQADLGRLKPAQATVLRRPLENYLLEVYLAVQYRL